MVSSSCPRQCFKFYHLDTASALAPSAKCTGMLYLSGGNPQMADWISVFVGVLGLVVSFSQYRARTKLETAVRDTLRRLAGEVNVTYSNASWADGHLRNIAKM